MEMQSIRSVLGGVGYVQFKSGRVGAFVERHLSLTHRTTRIKWTSYGMSA